MPTTWRLAGLSHSEDSLCRVEACSRCFVTGASRGLQEDLSSPSKGSDFLLAEIRTQLRLHLTLAPQARKTPQRGPPCLIFVFLKHITETRNTREHRHLNETQRDPLTRPQPENLQRPGARSGQQQAASSGRAGEEGPLAAAGREAPQRRGGVGLGMVGIAARMLHAAHGAQDAHAALGRHLKALTKPSGRVRGVWRGVLTPPRFLFDTRRSTCALFSWLPNIYLRKTRMHGRTPDRMHGRTAESALTATVKKCDQKICEKAHAG